MNKLLKLKILSLYLKLYANSFDHILCCGHLQSRIFLFSNSQLNSRHLGVFLWIPFLKDCFTPKIQNKKPYISYLKQNTLQQRICYYLGHCNHLLMLQSKKHLQSYWNSPLRLWEDVGCPYWTISLTLCHLGCVFIILTWVGKRVWSAKQIEPLPSISSHLIVLNLF